MASKIWEVILKNQQHIPIYFLDYETYMQQLQNYGIIFLMMKLVLKLQSFLRMW